MSLILGQIRSNELGELMAAGLSDSKCYFTWSTDGGTTWETPRLVTPDTVWGEQPGLVELPDGSLRIAVTQQDAVRIYASEDSGENWTSVGALT